MLSHTTRTHTPPPFTYVLHILHVLPCRYPFTYDPVYGLPVVNDVAGYGEVLRDMREGRVKELLWFFSADNTDPFFVDGRCVHCAACKMAWVHACIRPSERCMRRLEREEA